MIENAESSIHIALASDQNYFAGLLVTAASIARYLAEDMVLSLHVLDGGISAESFQLLNDVCHKLHRKLSVERICVNDAKFSNLPIWHGSRMAYARLLLPEFLQEVKHVIYFDVDFLCLADVSELWQSRRDDVILQGVREKFTWPGTYEDEMAFHAKLGLAVDRAHYINSGCVMMNLDAMRQEGFLKTAFDFMEQHTDAPFPDQSMFNILLRDRIAVLPDKWNTMSRELIPEMLKSGVAIHYAGAYQPWRASGLRWMFADNLMLWHRFNAKIRGISLWRSISVNCSFPEYVYRRMMFYLFALPVFKHVMIFIFSHTGERQRWWLKNYYLRHNSILRWSYD